MNAMKNEHNEDEDNERNVWAEWAQQRAQRARLENSAQLFIMGTIDAMSTISTMSVAVCKNAMNKMMIKSTMTITQWRMTQKESTSNKIRNELSNQRSDEALRTRNKIRHTGTQFTQSCKILSTKGYLKVNTRAILCAMRQQSTHRWGTEDEEHWRSFRSTLHLATKYNNMWIKPEHIWAYLGIPNAQKLSRFTAFMTFPWNQKGTQIKA